MNENNSPPHTMKISLSELEHRRFGIVTARAEHLGSREDVTAAVSFCAENNVDLLIARIDSNNLIAAQAIESIGGALCDTLIYFEAQTRKVLMSVKTDSDYTVRPFNNADRENVLQIAREAFSGYYGHYHSDSRLNRQDCDDTYVSWCESTIDNVGDMYDALVIEHDSEACGFLTVKKHDNDKLELMLAGIKRPHFGRGAYRRLTQAGIQYAATHKIRRIFTSTQITNLASQRLWTALGFIPTKSSYTFHVWF